MARILDLTSLGLNGSTVNQDLPTMHLEIDEGSGNLLAESMHGAHRLTGNVVREGQRDVFTINNVTRRRRYEGVFCAQLQPQNVMVIAGKIRLNVQFDSNGEPLADTFAEPGDEGYSPADRKKAFSQTQEVWIATKP